MPTTNLVTAEELAVVCKVSPQTIGDWARAGKIPVVRFSRKVIRFELDAVLAALRQPSVEREVVGNAS